MDGHLIHTWWWDGESYPEEVMSKLRPQFPEEVIESVPSIADVDSTEVLPGSHGGGVCPTSPPSTGVRNTRGSQHLRIKSLSWSTLEKRSLRYSPAFARWLCNEMPLRGSGAFNNTGFLLAGPPCPLWVSCSSDPHFIHPRLRGIMWTLS